MFDDYKVDYKTVDLLISMVGNDLRILSQEVEKLKTYKDNKEITYDDVLNCASSGDNDDIFDLSSIRYPLDNCEQRLLFISFSILPVVSNLIFAFLIQIPKFDISDSVFLALCETY